MTSPSAENPPLTTDALDYRLPQRLIATRPAEPRDSARLLVMHRGDDNIEHRRVRDLPEYLAPGDLLVFNNTAVAPARLLGRRTDSGGKVEGLFIEELSDQRWRLMLKSNGRLREGQNIELSDHEGRDSGHHLQLVERAGAQWIGRIDETTGAAGVLSDVGRTPLPPYIIRARAAANLGVDDDQDRTWYQTVYADVARRKSVAAPTAGLHFTQELLSAIDSRGVDRRFVTLHVGPGTFTPITADNLEEHDMHEEWYEAPADTLTALHEAKDRAARHRPSRILAVGTTTVRTLESLPDPLPAESMGPISGATDLFIKPPRPFRHVDGMMTNFHLPRSTLLALVAAMVGLDRLLDVYNEAVKREYRFYSYGDAMLILP